MGKKPGGAGVRVKCDGVCEGLGWPPGAKATGEQVLVGVGAAEAGGQGPHHPAWVRTQGW